MKSVIAGFIAALATIVLWIAAAIAEPLFAMFMQPSAGSGGIGAVSTGSVWVLPSLAIAFAVGFFWQFRRSSRAAHPGRQA